MGILSVGRNLGAALPADCGISLRSSCVPSPFRNIHSRSHVLRPAATCGLAARPADSACSHSAISALKAENKTNQTQMTMQSDTGLFGWQQDLLNLVQKGLVTVL